MKRHKNRIFLGLAIATTLCAIALAFVVVPHVRDLRAFRREMAALPNISPFDAYWQQINPHYVGWLTIDGTNINFPVVRAYDNTRYLTTTFFGEANIVGAIFMDYRNTYLSAPHIIIYGHEVHDEFQNPLMFGSLYRFLDEDFLAANNSIIFMADDTMHEFEIFSARQTDIFDPAYQLNFTAYGEFARFLERNGAPAYATQIITLSTCVGTYYYKRMIVQGSLIHALPVTTIAGEDGGWEIVRP